MSNENISGKLNGIEYWANSDDITVVRERSIAVHMQILSNVMLLLLFIRNTKRALVMVVRRSNKLAPWCCLIATSIGVLFFGGFTMAHHMPGGPSCIQVIWCSIICLTTSTIAVNTLLLERAYLAHCCNRWVLVMGILFIAPAPVLIYLNWIKIHATFSHKAACYADYPHYFPYVRAALDAPPNIVFSLSFISVIYRQYRRYGGQCWANLVHDGVVVMMLVVTSNLVCFIGNVISVFGEATDYLYVIDWAITTTLLVHNAETIRASPQTPIVVERLPMQRIANVLPFNLTLRDLDTDFYTTQKTNISSYL
ncbi:hypothetical protein BDF19DRAFT_419538 [Syncephalis fuscata]|nr:hypothetical protein BDF19DRAFT_419538 [Syncephalis fuscata]